MKSLKINSIGVEFPTNTTSVNLELVETKGIITQVTDRLTLAVPGIYQHLTNELFDIILAELKAEGFDVMTTTTAE